MNSVVSSPPFVFSPTVASAPAGASTASVDAWVGETRREISEIVREVAAAVRIPQSNQQFLAFLADRTLRAMAAEGVVIWRRSLSGYDDSPPPDWTVAVRLGRVTDLVFSESELPVHGALLDEVAASGTPVVVPSTPGATLQNVPANPAHVPVAVVPIEVNSVDESPIEFLIEVFIEPEGGVATQRGYLRFVSQMADLAAEFLRSDEIRRLKHRQSIQRQLDAMMTRMHASDDVGEIATMLVDGIADIFALDRVGLCQVSKKRSQLVAVSYVSTIAQNSPAADQIRQASLGLVDHSQSSSAMALATEQAAASGESQASDTLRVVAVLQASQQSKLRLVCLANDHERELSEHSRRDIEHSLQHASVAIFHAARWKVIPGARRLSSLVVGDEYSVGSKRGPIRMAFALSLLVAVIVIACLPVPLTVVASGTLRPSVLDNFCAVRSAVVETVHVEHGQSVAIGDPLVTLRDDDLEQQITTLMGRRAVLVEQQSRWTQALVDTATHRLDRTGQLQNERDLVAEELRGIDQQLALLEQIRSSLVLRAENDGIVDAWQLRQRLSGRPLGRGDYLLSVVGRDTPWVVDTQVPQNRVSSLQQAAAHNTLDVCVTSQTHRERFWAATMTQIGPGIRSSTGSGAGAASSEKPSSAVLMSLVDTGAWSADASWAEGPLNGSPVQVVCRCGRVPLAYALLQDAIVSIRSNYRMYVGSLSSQPSRTRVHTAVSTNSGDRR